MKPLLVLGGAAAAVGMVIVLLIILIVVAIDGGLNAVGNVSLSACGSGQGGQPATMAATGPPPAPGGPGAPPPPPAPDGTPTLLGGSTLNPAQLVGWFNASHKGQPPALHAPFAQIISDYVNFGNILGVRGDIAFAQTVEETGSFSNSDSNSKNNFAGIGHCDTCAAGLGFPTPEMGVLAQLELIKKVANGNGANLSGQADMAPQWHGVQIGTWGMMGDGQHHPGRWASDPGYWQAISSIYNAMLKSAGNPALAAAAAPGLAGGSGQCAPPPLPGVPVAAGPMTNPFPQGWKPERLDMGYDGQFNGQAVAPLAGTILFSGNFSNWGGWIELQADESPQQLGLPSNVFYFSENIKGIVPQGAHVMPGQPIGIAAINSQWHEPAGGIEWGLAHPGPIGTPVNVLGVGTPNAKQMVIQFANWSVQNLHIAPPASTDHAGAF